MATSKRRLGEVALNYLKYERQVVGVSGSFIDLHNVEVAYRSNRREPWLLKFARTINATPAEVNVLAQNSLRRIQ